MLYADTVAPDRASTAAETALTLYRIFQEALKNIEMHARARQVTVRLTRTDAFVQLAIHDDGIGFSPHEARPSSDGRGLGLVGSFERLSRVGGRFDVRSAPNGGGTRVLIEAPRT